MEQKKKPLIILAGPTAVGKTALSLRLAKDINGEIISADSMQVYRKMDIGTAKLPKEERQGIPHHLIDLLEPDEPFDVVRFQQYAKAAVEEITKKGKVPIVVGGTGFYTQALLYDIDFKEQKADKTERERLQKIAIEQGGNVLYRQLEEIDPESARAIHPNNTKRIIRALEYYAQTGQKISIHNIEQRKKESPYQFIYFALTMPREKLYERIDQRVEQMLEAGLLEEVRYLYEQERYDVKLPSMQGLGYREGISFLRGEISLSEMVRLIKRNTRHFAKRQWTWLQRERDVIWLEKNGIPKEEDTLLYQMKQMIAEKGIGKNYKWNEQ